MKKILIVDDSFFTRSIHRMTIEKEGYNVVEAGGGQEAIDLFEKEKPDLVITDLMMPDMDGMDVIKKILAIEPAAKTIVCSADRQTARQQEAQAIGALGFLAKPIDAESLNNLLEKFFT